MTEKLLQFIWQFQYFNSSALETTTGEKVEIKFPGHFNRNQGPDFLDAQVRISDTVWAGSVELHLVSGDWNKHRHENDTNYNNVILHVVWEDDGLVGRMPVLELKGRIPRLLLQRYEELMSAANSIPCGTGIRVINEISWRSWKDRLLTERLMRRSAAIDKYLHENRHNWEETFWWMLARNFGMKVNAEVFEAMARSLPLPLLARHRNKPEQLEAMLMGQAGLLSGELREEYPLQLQKDYAFYKIKYGFRPVNCPVFFLRMRPRNFPTIRLAQLARLLHDAGYLFTKIREAGSSADVKCLLDTGTSEYWDTHYRFNQSSSFRKKTPGADMINNIIINTAAPLVFAYGIYHRDQSYKDKALRWLEETAAEKNTIINGFTQLGVNADSAFDSQALLELKHEYCDKKMCLSCVIGNELLKKA